MEFSGTHEVEQICCNGTSKLWSYTDGSLTVSGSADDIPVPDGALSWNKSYSIPGVTVSFKTHLGLFFYGSASISGGGGTRSADCNNSGCDFGQISASLTMGIKATAGVTGCAETDVTHKICGGISVTPAAVSANVSGSAVYNIPCGTGFSGSAAVNTITSSVSVDIPYIGTKSWSYTVGGFPIYSS